MWMVYALLSAVFSALVAILSKVGLQGINSTYGTAIRTTVVLIVAWLFAAGLRARGVEMQVGKNQILFLVLSGLATGGAWLCYNKALQMGPATRVASLDKLSIVLIAVLSAAFLGENMSWKAVLSILMIASGTILLVFS